MHQITVGHSPDADDIFMYYAIKFGWIDTKDMSFNNLALDIETLNKDTLKGKYDICAISFALYPYVKSDFTLLRTAISFGYGYGPKLIKLKNKQLKKNFTVALSGEYTTNALLFKIKYPDARIQYMNFLDIEEAVVNGICDAGVLIHESILTFDNRLEVEEEMWNIWQELAGEDLPLPLGGMCLRRSIPINSAIKCEEILTKAVDIASKNKIILSKMLMQRNLIRVDYETLQKYLTLYANEDSIELSQQQIKALDKLYFLGYSHGLYKQPIKIEDFLIPREYKILRY
jgi:1,4-dihydroxy-6-naphthoate synthase